ncbi:MAG: extracellular solute-binding protein [bacterium]|nr:extracellular solute-binding protein [bacterium]
MRKLSMFQIMLLVIFGGLAVSGVLIFALAIGGGDTNTIGAVKIWGTLDQGAFSIVIRQATERDGQLSQVTYEQKDPATYESELTNALASGTGPDLFLMRQDYALKDAGKVALIPFSALSQAQFENAFIEAASPFLTQKGVTAVPLLADPLILYWNKDMLAAGGFAQPPKYWDELFNMAQKITTKDDTGSIRKSTVAFGEYQNVTNAKDIVATMILQSGSTITAYDNGGHLTPALAPRAGGATQASVSALRFYTEFADPSKNSYSWNRSLPEAQKAFASGDVALYIGYASEAPLIARTNPNLNFTASPMPQIRTGGKTLTAARVYALGASRAGKNPTAAITAAFLLASSENAKALSSALGIPSARRDVVGQSAQGTDDLFNKQAILANSWLDPDPEKTATLFRAMIEGTTSGTLQVSEAIQRADQQLAQILGL